jgi:rare lipoprotein A
MIGSTLRRTLTFAAITAFGLTAAGHAEQVAIGVTPTTSALVQPRGPVFVPSTALAMTSTEVVQALPEPAAATALGSGVASYYADRFHGQRTANGERYDTHEMTAAHRTLPFGSQVRVTNPRNGESVVVRINDRGPFSGNRTIDLSRAAAEQVGIVRAGHGEVELELIAG